MSEDSDYTSDINYPLPHQHNSSAHQFRGEPNFPLNRDRAYCRESPPYNSYNRDQYEPGGSFERIDQYGERRGSYEPVDSFDGRSFEREYMESERGDSFERTESFERDYDRDSEHYVYERSDTEYEQRSLRDDRYEPNGFDPRVRDYDLRSQHSSNRDYNGESDQDYMYSQDEYENTITNEDSLRSEQNKYRHHRTNSRELRQSDTLLDQSGRFDSQDRLGEVSQSSRGSQLGMHEPSSPFLAHGRSDTDSEFGLSYNSRPNPRQTKAPVNSSHRPGFG